VTPREMATMLTAHGWEPIPDAPQFLSEAEYNETLPQFRDAAEIERPEDHVIDVLASPPEQGGLDFHGLHEPTDWREAAGDA
jgi:hypothetical protein